jgi:hypothetical protein
MRRVLLPVLLLAFALPLAAADGDQSYISYDDGQTIVVQGYDGREIEARVNLPVFAGDQIVTGRRGRTEIRLADGSVIAVDRESAVLITAVGNTFESQDEQSVVSLRRGAAIVHQQRDDDPVLRLDTSSASYAALSAGIYSVELDRRGSDHVTVLSGSLEVRTQERAYRLRAGESARVDVGGISDVRTASGSENSFERWYLNRVDRYEGRRTRYLDSRYSWVEADLADHGDWVYVGEFGWVWRPYVVAGWRPYYHGSWHYGPRGHLIWSSYEPWGWYPYHYGRWTYSGMYGWVWLPGYRYSPAWVYWAYGPSWVGWVPSGWYDCYRPYNWIWNGYGGYYGGGNHNGGYQGVTVGVGFFGRVNLVGADLSGWTILESGAVISTRVDQAAMTLDGARARIARDGGRGVFSSSPVRLSGEDIKNPAAAVGRVSRLGLGGGTGTEGSGSLTDLTSFFRRDPELSPAVRSGLDRSNLNEAARRMTVPTPAPDKATSQTPGRSLARGGERGGAGTAGDTRAAQPRQGTISRGIPAGEGSTPSGRITRGTSTTPSTEPRAVTPNAPARGRVITRDSGSGNSAPRIAPAETPRAETPRAETPRTETRRITPEPDDSWRGRVVRPEPQQAPPARDAVTPAPSRGADRTEGDWRGTSSFRSPERSSPSSRGSSTRSDPTPIPRKVIDSIGGARIVPNRDSGSSRGGESRGRIGAPRSSSPSGSHSPGSPSRSGGGTVSAPRPSAPSSSSSPARSAPPASSSGDSKSNMRKD